MEALTAILLLQGYIHQLQADVATAASALRRLRLRAEQPPAMPAGPRALHDLTRDLRALERDVEQLHVYIEELQDQRDQAFAEWTRRHLGAAVPQ